MHTCIYGNDAELLDCLPERRNMHELLENIVIHTLCPRHKLDFEAPKAQINSEFLFVKNKSWFSDVSIWIVGL